MTELPTDLHWLFGNVTIDDVDAERDADFILGRVLELGRLVDVRWAIRFYGLDRIHAFFRDAAPTEVSERTKAFWRALLHAENEDWKSPPPWRHSSSAPWTG